MKKDNICRILQNFDAIKARYRYIRTLIQYKEKDYEKAKNNPLYYFMAKPDNPIGMPHNPNPGDPTGNIAVHIASGDLPKAIIDMQKEIQDLKRERTELSRIIFGVEKALKVLPKDQKWFISNRYFNNMTFSQLAEKYSSENNNEYISEYTLRRLEDKALDTMDYILGKEAKVWGKLRYFDQDEDEGEDKN